MKQPSKWTQFRLPLMILGAFIIIAAWVAFGRVFFGVLGWMAIVTLFLFGPAIILYGIILAIITAVRQRNYRYKKWGFFTISLIVTLAALFFVGFFMPDGGDNEASVGSAFSTLMMDRTNSALIGASGVLTGWSIFIAVVGSIVTFIAAFLERSKRVPEVPGADSLKQPK